VGFNEAVSARTAEGADPDQELPRMTLGEHLDELRRRVLKGAAALAVGIVVGLVFHQELFAFIRKPYDEALTAMRATGQIQGIGPMDGFLSSMKLCFLGGLVGTSPFWLAQLWGFVAAGLYPRERKAVRLFFPVSVGLFALGCVFAYLIVLPIGLRFLLSWNANMGISGNWGVDGYLSLCLMLAFGLGLAFELPLLMLFVQATGIIERRTLTRSWRLAVLSAFVIAMIITPDTSPVSMTLVAVPLVALYFLGVHGGRFVGEEREPFRVWHAWPLVLAAGALTALFWFRADLTAWAGSLWT
jgi:sec-independent protein translocase protein TatC